MQTSIATITAVIPTYRRPKTLRRAILSAMQQTFRNLAIVVYDDASGDETETVVLELAKQDSRIRYVRHDANIGAAANFAYAAADVRSPFFTVLCDDDVILPHFYEFALATLMKETNVALFAGYALRITDRVQVISKPSDAWTGEVTYPPLATRLMLDGAHPAFPTTVFRTLIVNDLGGINPRAGSLIDIDLFARIAAHNPIVLSTEPCGFLSVHNGSWSSRLESLAIDYNYIIDRLDLLADRDDVQTLSARLRSRRDLHILQQGLRSLQRATRESTASYIATLVQLHNPTYAGILALLSACTRIVPKFGTLVNGLLEFRQIRMGAATLRHKAIATTANPLAAVTFYAQLCEASGISLDRSYDTRAR